MNGRIHIYDNHDVCNLCGCYYKHRRVLRHTAARDIKEVEFINHCARCRSVLRRYNKLNEELLELQWFMFGLGNTDYFDSTDVPT